MGQLSNLTNLTSLRLQFAARGHRSLVSENAVRSLLNGAQELRELSLVNCQLLTLHTFPEEGVYTNLVKLTMSECFQLDDVAVDRVTQLCPNLKVSKIVIVLCFLKKKKNSFSIWDQSMVCLRCLFLPFLFGVALWRNCRSWVVLALRMRRYSSCYELCLC